MESLNSNSQEREFSSVATMQDKARKVAWSKSFDYFHSHSPALDADLVVMESNGTESGKQDTSSSSRNYLTHVVDADIKSVNDQVPFAKVDSNTTPDSTNMCHRGGEIDQDAEQYQSFAVHKKPNTLRSCLRWKPTGRIFKNAGLRWIPIGKMFTDSTTKVDSEPPNGSNDDITIPYECDQTLNVSACTLNLSACISFNPLKKRLRVWLPKRLISHKPGVQGILIRCTYTMASADNTSDPAPQRKERCTLQCTLSLKEEKSSYSRTVLSTTSISSHARLVNKWINYFKPPPNVDHPVPAASTCSPSSTTVDQDAPSDTYTGNHVNDILLKLNLPDHMSVHTDPEDQVKMEMEIPHSSKVNFITACSYSTDTSKDIMKAQVYVSKLPQL
ncbi:hypothetical protein Tco_1515162 [Tanacetum coccineum]